MKIVLDMDGTIADLYNVPNWLEYLKNGSPHPYEVAQPMINIIAFNKWVTNNNITVVICSWLAKNATADYNKQVRKAKREWLKNCGIVVDKIHIVKYGTPKHTVTKATKENQLLFDDDFTVRQKWSKYAPVLSAEHLQAMFPCSL